MPASVAASANISAVSGVSSAGLSTMVLPAAIGRQDLPGRHLQRVVPRGDRADHADRLAADVGGVVAGVLARGLALEVAGGAGEERDVVDGAGDVEVGGEPDRLAGLPRLGAGQVVGPLGEQGREPGAARPTARPGGALDQAGNAARAAATAASTSAPSASTTCSTVSPVEGSVTSKRSPEPPVRRRPAMNWCTLRRPLRLRRAEWSPIGGDDPDRVTRPRQAIPSRDLIVTTKSSADRPFQ